MRRVVYPTPDAAMPVAVRDDLVADGTERSWSVVRCPACTQLWPTPTSADARAAPDPLEPRPLAGRVHALMQRRVACVSTDVSLDSLAWWLLGRGLTSAPVVDDDGKLAGFVSMSDLVRALVADDLEPLPPGLQPRLREAATGFHDVSLPRSSVRDIMTPVAITVLETDTLAEAARRMTEHRVHQLAVVNADRSVVGLLSSLDLARALAR